MRFTHVSVRELRFQEAPGSLCGVGRSARIAPCRDTPLPRRFGRNREDERPRKRRRNARNAMFGLQEIVCHVDGAVRRRKCNVRAGKRQHGGPLIGQARNQAKEGLPLGLRAPAVKERPKTSTDFGRGFKDIRISASGGYIGKAQQEILRVLFGDGIEKVLNDNRRGRGWEEA